MIILAKDIVRLNILYYLSIRELPMKGLADALDTNMDILVQILYNKYPLMKTDIPAILGYLKITRHELFDGTIYQDFLRLASKDSVSMVNGDHISTISGDEMWELNMDPPANKILLKYLLGYQNRGEGSIPLLRYDVGNILC